MLWLLKFQTADLKSPRIQGRSLSTAEAGAELSLTQGPQSQSEQHNNNKNLLREGRREPLISLSED